MSAASVKDDARLSSSCRDSRFASRAAGHNRGMARDGATESMLPEHEVQFPTTIHRAHRRPLGLGPTSLLAALAVVAFVLAIVLFALGYWAAAIVCLALSAAEVGLLLVAIRHEPDASSARVAVSAAGRADGIARVAIVMVRAWSRAGAQLARLWHRRQRLRLQLRRRLAPLGEAVYRDEDTRAEQLKIEALQLDEALKRTDRQASEAIAAARREIDQERVPVQSTQRLAGSDRDHRRQPELR